MDDEFIIRGRLVTVTASSATSHRTGYWTGRVWCDFSERAKLYNQADALALIKRQFHRMKPLPTLVSTRKLKDAKLKDAKLATARHVATRAKSVAKLKEEM